MALQIANPIVVQKDEHLARATGLSKTAALERAVDRLLMDTTKAKPQTSSFAALLEQFDQIPDRGDVFNPIAWDKLGLPK